MTKDEIIDYVLNSPENTNPNVLKGMLDQLDNGGSSEGIVKYNTLTVKNISDVNVMFGLGGLINDGIIVLKSWPIVILGDTEMSFNFITSQETGAFNEELYFQSEDNTTISVSDLSGWEKEQETDNSTSLIYFSEDTPLVDQNLVVTVSVSLDDDDSGNDDEVVNKEAQHG